MSELLGAEAYTKSTFSCRDGSSPAPFLILLNFGVSGLMVAPGREIMKLEFECSWKLLVSGPSHLASVEVFEGGKQC